jgi:hypothetical protein
VAAAPGPLKPPRAGRPRLRRRWALIPAIAAAAIFLAAGCGAGAGPTPVPTPTPNTPDAGECIDLTGPDDDLTMTVVDCATGAYEVLHVIGMVAVSTCPPATDFEIERSVTFVPAGRTPASTSGGLRQETFCLRDLAPGAGQSAEATSEATAAANAELAADDVTYTSKASLGGSIVLEIQLSNAGTGASAPILLEVGDLMTHADLVLCTPECEAGESSGDWFLTFPDGIAGGASATYEVEFEAIDTGTVEWRVSIVEGRTNEFFVGTATTTIE